MWVSQKQVALFTMLQQDGFYLTHRCSSQKSVSRLFRAIRWWQQLRPRRLDLSWTLCVLLLQCKHPWPRARNGRYFTCLVGRLFLVPSQMFPPLCLKTNACKKKKKNSSCRIRQAVVASVIWCDSGWDCAAVMDFSIGIFRVFLWKQGGQKLM